jgi:hypothetical protein
MLELLSIFSSVTELAVIIGIPLVIFARRARSGERNLALRFFVSVLLVWAGVIAHRLLIGLPVAMRRADANGRPDYDGVGGNVACLIGGWMTGILGAIVAMVIPSIVEWIVGRRKAKLLAADESARPRDMLQGEVNPYATGEPAADDEGGKPAGG